MYRKRRAIHVPTKFKPFKALSTCQNQQCICAPLAILRTQFAWYAIQETLVDCSAILLKHLGYSIIKTKMPPISLPGMTMVAVVYASGCGNTVCATRQLHRQ
jgi:hypothetical protein